MSSNVNWTPPFHVEQNQDGRFVVRDEFGLPCSWPSHEHQIVKALCDALNRSHKRQHAKVKAKS